MQSHTFGLFSLLLAMEDSAFLGLSRLFFELRCFLLAPTASFNDSISWKRTITTAGVDRLFPPGYHHFCLQQ
jgi:hypothetical protein